jgi:hypothetical protein
MRYSNLYDVDIAVDIRVSWSQQLLTFSSEHSTFVDTGASKAEVRTYE